MRSGGSFRRSLEPLGCRPAGKDLDALVSNFLAGVNDGCAIWGGDAGSIRNRPREWRPALDAGQEHRRSGEKEKKCPNRATGTHGRPLALTSIIDPTRGEINTVGVVIILTPLYFLRARSFSWSGVSDTV